MKQSTFQFLTNLVSKEMDVSVHDLMAHVRTDRICRARFMLMHLARLNRYKFEAIGEYMGKDHGSAINAVKRIADIRSVEPHFDKLTSKLEQRAVLSDEAFELEKTIEFESWWMRETGNGKVKIDLKLMARKAYFTRSVL